MTQKPVLRGEVGCACVAREVSVERGGMGERGARVRRFRGCNNKNAGQMRSGLVPASVAAVISPSSLHLEFSLPRRGHLVTEPTEEHQTESKKLKPDVDNWSILLFDWCLDGG